MISHELGYAIAVVVGILVGPTIIHVIDYLRYNG